MKNKKQIEELWLKHIDVQEQILKLRSAPIAIVPNSVAFSAGKLTLTVDQTNNVEEVKSLLSRCFNLPLEDVHSTSGYILINSDKTFDQNKLNDISYYAEKNHIHVSTQPIINGYIKKPVSYIEQVKNELKRSNIDAICDSGNIIIKITALDKLVDSVGKENISMPNTATVIFRIAPSPVCYLSKIYPNIDWHYVKRIKHIYAPQIELGASGRIQTKGGYINDTLLHKLYNEFDLNLYSYLYKFYISKQGIPIYEALKDKYPLPFDEDHLCFKFYVPNQIKTGDCVVGYNDELHDYNLKYTRLKRFFDAHFGKGNIREEIIFEYSYDRSKFEIWSKRNVADFDMDAWYNELFSTIYDNPYMSVSKEKMQIGIDFIWQDGKSIENLNKIIDALPTIEISVLKGHNCRISLDFDDGSLDDIENKLREGFPSIQVKKKFADGILIFWQEYDGKDGRRRLYTNLKRELGGPDFNSFVVCLEEPLEGKDKYLFEIDESAIQETSEEVIKELRGADLEVDNQPLGKLIKIKYPQLIVDFDGNEDLMKMFQVGAISVIHPNLTGDMEKLYRLKKAFGNIIKGEGVKNQNLSHFIFDATQATPTQDIEFYTHERSEYYQEIKNNLLNKHINPSQLNAIIKCLVATDLAIIQGPPGTGKSTAIAELIWQHIRLNPKERILLTSETNLAVDNAIDRTVNGIHNLVKPIRFGSEDRLAVEGRQFSVAAMEQWVETGKFEFFEEDDESIEGDELQSKSGTMILMNWLENIKKRIDRSNMDSHSASLWKHVLENPDKQLRQLIFDQYKSHCNVVGATCSSIGEKNTKNRPTKFFMNYCSVFGEVGTKTIYKKGIDFTDEDDGIEVSTYSCKDGITFSTVIQDESSKATPAELSLPLIYGEKNIIIGDHRQLPPLLDKEEFLTTLDFLYSRTDNPQERRKITKLRSYVLSSFEELEISHFQRLYENIDESLKGVFNTQYRMHPDINDVIKQFYVEDGGIECGIAEGADDYNMNNPASRYHGINIDGLISPNNHVIWIDTSSPEMLDGTSHINHGEIEAIKWVLSHFQSSSSFKAYQSFWKEIEDQQIGLITFYGKQVKLLRNMRRNFPNLPMRISTVDRFQGMERNIIIVSMVRSNCVATSKNQLPDKERYGELGYTAQNKMGFAQSPNRLNVALSRAKRLLIIVGNSKLFRQKDIYDNVYKSIATNPNGRIIKYK